MPLAIKIVQMVRNIIRLRNEYDRNDLFQKFLFVMTCYYGKGNSIVRGQLAYSNFVFFRIFKSNNFYNYYLIQRHVVSNPAG